MLAAAAFSPSGLNAQWFGFSMNTGERPVTSGYSTKNEIPSVKSKSAASISDA